MNCPSQEKLRQSLAGDLPEAEADGIFVHAETCSACQTIMQSMEATLSDPVEQVVRSMTPREAPSLDCERMMRDSSLFVLQSSVVANRNPHDTCFSGDTVRLIELVPGVDSIRDYLVQDRLGQGGMGTVYRATHRHLKRDVAIKVLKPRRQQHEESVGRFRKEMEAVGGLDHKNIIRAMDAGESDGTLYLVMEQIEGLDVGQLIADGPLGFAEACDIVQQSAIGLAYAHRKQMVHRDIKPSNLMVTPQGVVKILDFGIATFDTVTIGVGPADVSLASPVESTAPEPLPKAQASPAVPSAGDEHTTLAGSLAYMAPEQCRSSKEVAASADIFSLGCTFAELLTGKSLFELSGDIGAQLQQRLDATSPPVTDSVLPGRLAAFVDRMLSENPADRPSADHVARELTPHAMSSQLHSLVCEHVGTAVESESSETGAWASRVSQAGSNTHKKSIIGAILVSAVASAILIGWAVLSTGEDRDSKSSAAVSASTEAQVLADIASVKTTTAAIRIQTLEHQVKVRHGYEIQVVSADNSVNATSWNSFALKLEHPEAFGIYQRHEELLRAINDSELDLYPHSEQAISASQIVRESHDEETGWSRYDGWTPGESARLWIGPAKLAIAYVSNPNGENKSNVQPLEQLLPSEEFGPWVHKFIGPTAGDSD